MLHFNSLLFYSELNLVNYNQLGFKILIPQIFPLYSYNENTYIIFMPVSSWDILFYQNVWSKNECILIWLIFLISKRHVAKKAQPVWT